MNKFQLTATGLLISGVSLPLSATDVGKADYMSPPLVAADKGQIVSPSANSVPKLMKVGSQSDKDVFGFTFQHYLNLNGVGMPLPKDTIAITPDKFETNPLFFLEILKQPYAQLDLLPKPVQANTLIEWLLPQSEAKIFGKPPALLLTTNISSEGTGGDLVVFPYQREVHLSGDKSLFDWKGLKGQFAFSNKPGPQTFNLNLLGLTIEETERKDLVSLEESTFKGVFNVGADSSIIPSQINLNLPSFKGHFDKEGDWNLQALTFDMNSKQTSKGLVIGETNFQLGHFDITSVSANDPTGSIDQVKLAFKLDEQDDVASFTIQAEIGKLLVPKKLQEIGYMGDITLRRFDANALLTLQTIAKQLSKAPNDEAMAQVMMSQNPLELIPQILAKSPEITFNDSIKTSKGSMQTQLIVGIDGTKVTSLENTSCLIPALQAHATFSVDKTLLTQYLEIVENDSPRKAREVKEQISMFVAQKWLIETEDSYKSAAEFKNGKLTVNGQELPIPLPSIPLPSFGTNESVGPSGGNYDGGVPSEVPLQNISPPTDDSSLIIQPQ